jgi:hypothetical protein
LPHKKGQVSSRKNKTKVNKMKKEQEKINEQEKLLCPKAGTATSSPAHKTASHSNMNIINVMLWMKKNESNNI